VKTSEQIDYDLIESIRTISHPLRFHALKVLNERVASPKELAHELGEENVGNVAYHVRELAKSGKVELVSTKQRRGATEHFYRATERAFFSDEDWLRIPNSVRGELVAIQLRELGRLLSAAIESGSFEARSNRHHSHYEALVDEQGWNEAMAVLEETMGRLKEVEVRGAERRLESEEDPIPLAVSIIGFEKAPAG
jgi:hypothetical protein